MGRNRRRRRRNLNGLHEEVVAPSPAGLNKLPAPTTPLGDIKVLIGERDVSSLLDHAVERLGFSRVFLQEFGGY